jgi:hypothetical protein
MTPEEEGGRKLSTSRMTQQEYRHSIHRRISTLQSMTKSEPHYQHLGSLTTTFNFIVAEGLSPITFEQSLQEIEHMMRSDKDDTEKLSEIKKMQFLDI